MSKHTPSQNNTPKAPVIEKAPEVEVVNTTPPEPTAADALPLAEATTESSGESATSGDAPEPSESQVHDSEVVPTPVIQVDLSATDGSVIESAKLILEEYNANMNRDVQYDRDLAVVYQSKLIRLVYDWVKSAKLADSGDTFFKLGRLLTQWFSENIEGCAAPELIHRGLKSLGTPIKNESDYGRWATLVALFHRIDNAAQRAILSDSEEEVINHFKAASNIDSRFLELLAQALREKRF